jgi:hypothetical protein
LTSLIRNLLRTTRPTVRCDGDLTIAGSDYDSDYGVDDDSDYWDEYFAANETTAQRYGYDTYAERQAMRAVGVHPHDAIDLVSPGGLPVLRGWPTPDAESVRNFQAVLTPVGPETTPDHDLHIEVTPERIVVTYDDELEQQIKDAVREHGPRLQPVPALANLTQGQRPRRLIRRNKDETT